MEEGKAAPPFRRRSRKHSNPRSTFYNPIKEAWEEEQRKLAEEEQQNLAEEEEQQKLAEEEEEQKLAEEEEEQRKLLEEPPPSPETPRWQYMKDYERSFPDVGGAGGENISDATSPNIGKFLRVKFEPGESSHGHGDQRK